MDLHLYYQLREMTTNMETLLTRIEGEVRTSSSVLNSFQELLDKTFNILTEKSKDNFNGLPMWLFESYSELSELKENKSLYATDKYARVQELKTAFYQTIMQELGLETTRRVIGLGIERNIFGNDYQSLSLMTA